MEFVFLVEKFLEYLRHCWGICWSVWQLMMIGGQLRVETVVRSDLLVMPAADDVLLIFEEKNRPSVKYNGLPCFSSAVLVRVHIHHWTASHSSFGLAKIS
jgi:hypothetical protein